MIEGHQIVLAVVVVNAMACIFGLSFLVSLGWVGDIMIKRGEKRRLKLRQVYLDRLSDETQD